MVIQLYLRFQGANGAELTEECVLNKKTPTDIINPLANLLRRVELCPQHCTMQLHIQFKDAGHNHIKTLRTDFKSQLKPTPPALFLTKREMEVAHYINQGYSCNAISQKMNISYDTVRKHRANIYNKLHVCNCIEFSKRMAVLHIALT